jgi:hypothetical protein
MRDSACAFHVHSEAELPFARNLPLCQRHLFNHSSSEDLRKEKSSIRI